jgi:diguanylate cyclase (GGDEF)-like protein/putative nucleotidyltransferase with HDIG domain
MEDASRVLDRLHMSRWPVRSKLALGFVIAGVLPLVMFAVVSLRSTEQSLREQAATEMNNRNDALRAALDGHGRSILDQVASHSVRNAFCAAMDRRDVAWLASNTTTWVVENSQMTGAQALTLDGRIVSAAGDFEHVSLYESPVVAAAGQTGQNGFDFRTIDGRLFIVGAGPIIEEGVEDAPRHGIVVFGEPVDGATLAGLASIIGASQLDVYEGGRLLASSAGSAAKALPAGARVGAAATSGSDTVLLTALRDRSGQPQAVLGLRVDSAAVAVTTSTLRKTAAYAMTAALIIALLAELIVTRMLSRPLQRLANGARAIAGGATRQRVDIQSRDEFGEVAAAFNLMSEQLSKAFAELEQRSSTDGLTGLLNHRATHQTLAGETARSRRYGTAFSLLLLDVDDLKLLNNTHGHPAGDQLLSQVSRILSEQTREADFVGRVGGDEFMIIMPETRPGAATVVAEKMREAISAQPYVAADGQRIPVHVSMGIASFPEDGSEANALVAYADANLYTSKRRGGNAITHKEDEVRQEEDEMTAFGMLESLVTAVDNKDSYTHHHSDEVTEYALTIAVALGLSEETQRIVRVAGLLHDVGKIGVPGSILRKPGRLTSDEYEIMKQHTLLGELIIQEVPNLKEIRAAVVSHHERWDGSGYPHGLAGDAIPLMGRMMSVADAYSAMTSDRPYRSSLTTEVAIAELRAGAGNQFDPALVELFVEALAPALCRR